MAKVVIQLQDASKLLDVHAVEAAVTQLEGVEYARVSRTTGKVTVAFDASKTSQTAIEHALQALGHMTSDVQPANTIRIPIEGMTCASCQARIATALQKQEGVASAEVSLSRGEAAVSFDPLLTDRTKLTQTITKLGYTVPEAKASSWSRHGRTAGLIALIGALYVLMEHFGVLNLLAPSALATAEAGYGMLFVIGLMTSVHCVAMCGGINLSQCIGTQAIISQGNAAWKPSLLYNAGRVISYTLIGFVVGALGSAISFSFALQGILKLIAAFFMLVMALNMLGLFPGLSRIVPRLPQWLSRRIGHKRRSVTSPLMVGLLNGLMPCGPLQAMQLYALSTGNAWAGALSMLLFSLGTVPLMFGFGALSTALGRRFTSGVMAAGAVLLAVLGLSMFSQGISLAGWQGTLVAPPASVAEQPTASTQSASAAQPQEPMVQAVQKVGSTLEAYRYPNITVQVGVPVEWTVTAPEGSINGCNNRMIIQEYGIEHTFAQGDNLITFTPDKVGTYAYSCWMGMIRATITAVDDPQPAQQVASPATDQPTAAPDRRFALGATDAAPVLDGQQANDTLSGSNPLSTASIFAAGESGAVAPCCE